MGTLIETAEEKVKEDKKGGASSFFMGLMAGSNRADKLAKRKKKQKTKEEHLKNDIF